MKTKDIIERLEKMFPTSGTEGFDSETGLTHDAGKAVSKIGYTTNLTPDVIEKAKAMGVDLILTHHDAWKFIYGIKEKCMEMLKAYGISHYYVHLPLDDADFGTNSALAERLGFKVTKKMNDCEGFKCGVLAEIEDGISLKVFVERAEKLMGEKVQTWQFNDRLIKRIHIICGAGFITTDMKEGVDEGVDLYMTGERILYTVEYAQLHEVNLVVGSHTFVELPGVESMVMKLVEQLNGIEACLIEERHIEAEVL